MSAGRRVPGGPESIYSYGGHASGLDESQVWAY